ncbi:hypothetical protein A3759_03760 [Thalassolituus sp. HI0120]|nr:hypothetical protein A3759_03760 [Thalassolituus sp. HI0120]
MTPIAKSIAAGWILTALAVMNSVLLFFCFESMGIKSISDDETLATWFQRCGACLTLSVICIEVFIEQRLQKLMGGLPSVENLDNNGKTLHIKQHDAQQACLLILAVVGTIIWGFGDLIYIAISKI